MVNRPRAAREARNKLSRWLAWLLGAVVLTVVIYQVTDEAQRAKLLSRGSIAPPFTAERFTGGAVQSEQLRGKVVMLDFWATWCPPCVEEMPSLVRLGREFESKGLVFVAANRDERSSANAEVTRFVRQRAPELAPSVVYANDEMSLNYRAEALPTLYFIGRDGRILDSSVGYDSESSLRRRIERALQ